jgi:hypothetical protein
MRGYGRLALGDGNSGFGTRDFTPKPATEPLIISYKGNKSSSTSMTGFRDGLTLTPTGASSALMSNALHLVQNIITQRLIMNILPVIYPKLYFMMLTYLMLTLTK